MEEEKVKGENFFFKKKIDFGSNLNTLENDFNINKLVLIDFFLKTNQKKKTLTSKAICGGKNWIAN